MKARINVHALKLILSVPAAMSALMVAVALLSGEAILAWSFVAMAITTLGILLLFHLVANAENDGFSTGETLATAALAWALVAILGAIPFSLSAWLLEGSPAVRWFNDPLNSMFESVSGFTSTGLTMVDQPSELPATLQFWRSFMEWIGGVGLAVLVVALMNPKNDGGDLFNSELNKTFSEDIRKTAIHIWWIYSALTIVGIALFAALGMPLWESVNHGMTAIATGGFSITDDSFRVYSIAIQVTAMILMILGAISFAAYYEGFITRKPLRVFQRGPIVFLVAGLAVASAILWLSRWEFETDGGFYVAIFQAVSAFATAGFSTVSLSDWHSAPLAVLIVCMTIGGASGATTGGVKTDRYSCAGGSGGGSDGFSEARHNKGYRSMVKATPSRRRACKSKALPH